jgi:NADH dehydrogenase
VIDLVEGLDEILPNSDPGLQRALRARLERRDVRISCDTFVSAVDETTVYCGENGEMDYDVLVWTGGITGREPAATCEVKRDERSNRIHADRTFQTEDERVFALGDAALIDQDGGEAPPTAQAAWQAAEVVGKNIARAIRGEPLDRWTYDDKGTVISVGEAAVAHDVSVVPGVDTFGGYPATLLKKAIAARWIKDVSSYRRALSAWPDM